MNYPDQRSAFSFQVLGAQVAQVITSAVRRLGHWIWRRRTEMRILQGAALGLLLGQAAFAGPQGEHVRGGQANIHRPDGNTTIIDQYTNRLAVDWQNFNTSSTELVQFNQPSASAAALNRILDHNPTEFFGSLKANGQVFLLNPAGILFGRNANVSVGSLIASNMDMKPGDFMAGNYNLHAVPGMEDSAVINRGLIEAASGGSVSLIGGKVANEGLIVAKYGHVNLASGSAATLDFNGDGLIRFEVSGEASNGNAGTDYAVTNSGQIIADGGHVLMKAVAAKDVFSNLINQTGKIRAARIDNQGGVVRLVGTGGTTLHSGQIDVSGQDAVSTGGTVHVLGEHAGLVGDASIDASGPAGGGTVLVGGDFQGSNPDVPNASRTYVGPDAVITADSFDDGDGGKVIVWADQWTKFYGSISARGGAEGGDGGFAEVSGKHGLTFAGNVDTRAPKGSTGTLLLDPDFISIIDAAGDQDANLAADDTIDFTDLNTLLNTLSVGQINAATTNVNVNAGEIRFNNANNISMGAGLSVSFAADNTADPNSSGGNNTIQNTGGNAFSITTTGVGNIGFTAGGLIDLTNITINSGSDITVDAGGSATLSAATAGGTLDVTADAIDVTGAVSANAIDFDASGGAGNITDTGAGALSVTTTSLLVAQATDDILLDAAGNDFGGAVTVDDGVAGNDANNVTLVDADTLELGTVTIAGNLDVTATAGNITDSGTLTIGGASSFTANDGASADIILDSPANDFTGAVSFAGANLNNVTIVDNSALALQALTISGLLDVTADAIDVTGAVSANAIDFDASGGAGNITDTGAGALSVTTTSLLVAQATDDILLDAAINDFGGAVTVDDGVAGNDANNVTLVDADTLELGTVTIAGNLDVTATAGNITDSGTLTIGGASSFTANDGASADIILDSPANDFTGAVSFAGANLNNVTIVDNSALALQALTISGLLDVTADAIDVTGAVSANAIDFDASGGAGNITDSGAGTLSVATTSLLVAQAGDDILLDAATNDFGGAVTVDDGAPGADANNVTLVDANALTLSTATIAGTLDVTADAIDVTGAVSANAIDFDASGGAGNITDSGAGTLSVTTTSLLVAQATDDILLDAATNDFGGAVTVDDGVAGNDANNVTLVDADTLELGTVTIAGNLDVTATAGNITDSGTLTIGGASSFTANDGASADIILDSPANDFTGAVSFAGANLNNVTIVDNSALALQALTISGLLEVAADAIDVTGAVSANAIDFDASGGAGNITDTGAGALSVTTTSLLVAQAGDDILLDAATNDFGGAVTVDDGVAGNDANNVTLVDADTLELGTVTIAGNLDVTATAGNITDSGTLTIGGASSFTANDGASADIILDSPANDFTGAVSFAGANLNNVTIVDNSALALQALTISGLLDVTADAIDVTGAVSANAIDFDASGGVGDITDTGAGTLSVTTTSLLVAQAGDDILLDAATNDFGGAVTVDDGAPGADANNVTLVDADTLELGTVTIAGNLDVTATAGNITDSGTLTIGGASSFTANDGASADIILDSPANDFTGAVSFAGANLNNVTIVDNSALALQALTISGLLDVTADAIDVTGAVSANAIDFDASGGVGDITDSGAGTLSVATTSLLVAQAGDDILLDAATNDFGGAVTVDDGAPGADANNVTLVDANALTLSTATIAGTLDVTADAIDVTGAVSANAIDFDASGGAGNITDSGAGTLSVTTTSLLVAQATDDILLDAATNDFGGAVTVDDGVAGNDANNVTLVDADTLELGTVTIAGNLDVTATAGNITDSGTLTIGGASSFTANDGASADIILDSPANDFTGAVTFAGANLNNVTIVDNSALALQALTISGLLEVAADAIDVTGAVSANAIDFDASGGAGNITDTGAGALSVTTTSLLVAQAGDDILLDAATNDFGGAVTVDDGVAGNDANNVTLVDANALTLSTATIAGTLDVTADAIDVTGAVSANAIDFDASGGAGNITDTGAGTLSVATTSLLVAQAGDDILLDAATNDFGGAVTVDEGAPGADANNVTLVDADTLTLSTATIAGTLDVTADAIDVTGAVSANAIDFMANGNINQNAAIASSGNVTVESTNGNIKMGSSSTTAIGQEIRYAAPEGNILLGLLDAGKGSGGGVVRIQKEEFGVAPFGAQNAFNDNGGQVNIRAATAFVEVANQLGRSGDPVIFDVSPGPITLYGTSGTIANLNRVPLEVLGGQFFDEVGRAIGATAAATASGLKTIAYVDWSLLAVDVSLFGTVEQGILMPCTQREDIDPEECEQEMEPVSLHTLPQPDDEMLVSTLRGWRWLPVFWPAGEQGNRIGN